MPARYKSAVGRAWIECKTIKIPEIVDVETFLVALHEIGHIVRAEVAEPLFLCEYAADRWALDTAAEYGIDPGYYLYRSRWYVLSFIAELHNQGVKYKVPKEIARYVQEDLKSWKHYKRIQIYYTKTILTIRKEA